MTDLIKEILVLSVEVEMPQFVEDRPSLRFDTQSSVYFNAVPILRERIFDQAPIHSFGQVQSPIDIEPERNRQIFYRLCFPVYRGGKIESSQLMSDLTVCR